MLFDFLMMKWESADDQHHQHHELDSDNLFIIISWGGISLSPVGTSVTIWTIVSAAAMARSRSIATANEDEREDLGLSIINCKTYELTIALKFFVLNGL